MPVELSALFERKYAPVAQWIEQLTSDYPGRCAVLPSVGREAKPVELSALFKHARTGHSHPACAVAAKQANDAPAKRQGSLSRARAPCHRAWGAPAADQRSHQIGPRG